MISRGHLVEKHEGRGIEELEKLTGPPIAPKMTASACCAAVSASSVSGDPVASIEACKVFRFCQIQRASIVNVKGKKERASTHAAQQVFLKFKLNLRSLLRHHPENLDFVKPGIYGTIGFRK